MTGNSVIFSFEGVDHEIALARDHAPGTVDAPTACLPMKADIHCAKIAGSHIFWHAPFLTRLEVGTDIMALGPGAFVYFPERQFLELIYAPLQAETAAVNVLGELRGDIGWLTDLADRNRREQGSRLFTAELFVTGGERRTEAPAISPGHDPLSRLRAARQAVWRAEPEETRTLLARRGLMLPFGPLAMAEGEMRKLHELLWRLWDDRTRWSRAEKVVMATFAIEAAISRVAGFCHLTDSGAVLQDGIACFEDEAQDVEAVLEELVLYCGRIAAWLDLHICWWPMNEITLKAQD